MQAAFSIWEERIAPVFDVAARLAIVGEAPDDCAPVRVSFSCQLPEAIVSGLLGHRVSVLVCGAISRPLHDMLVSRGIKVHPFVSGELGEVIQAWRDQRLEDARFCMPGCGGSSGLSRSGAGHRFRRRGAASPYGASVISVQKSFCRCPNCGYTVEHMPGRPCFEQQCPQCHALMERV